MVSKASRYVTVGFDSEAKANNFRRLVEGNGLLVRLYETVQDEGGAKKGRVNSIQARSCHEWTPSSWERRRFEYGGVTIEFKDQLKANEYMYLVMGLLSGAFNDAPEGSDGVEDEPREIKDSDFHAAATALALLLRPENVVGAKIERD